MFGGSLAKLALFLAVASDFAQLGRQKYAANEFSEAAVEFRKAVKANPSDRNARLWLGYTYLALDDLEAALRNLEPLRESMSSDPEYLFAASKAYTRSARRLSERIAALGGDSARAHEILAYRYRAVGQPKDAITELRRAAELRPGLAGLHLELAEIFWQQRQFDEAAIELAAEIRISPTNFLANLRYGQYLLRTGAYQDAIGPLTISAGYRKYPEAFQLIAYAWGKLGKPEERLAALRGGLAVFPGDQDLTEMCRQFTAENPQVSSRVWSPPLLREDPPPSLPQLRAALARTPIGEDALYWLSRVYSERGQSLLEELEQVAPHSYRVLQEKGLNAEYEENYEKAAEYYRRVVSAQPRLGGVHYALGHVLRKLGREDEGMAEIGLELALDPRHYLACYELGSGRLGRGEAFAAVPLLQRAILLRPGFAEAQTDLAKAFLQLKRWDDAVRVLRSVIANHPKHPSAHFLLYRAYAAKGSVDLANRELGLHQTLLKKSPRGSDIAPVAAK